MRSSLLCLLAVVTAVTSSQAFAADAVVTAQQALAGDDSTAKRQAIRALGSKGAGDDEAAFALLVSALSDRQASEAAATALRSRSGASPLGGEYRPSAPAGQLEKAWGSWFIEWKGTNDLKKKTAAMDKQLKELEAAKAKLQAAGGATAAGSVTEVAAPASRVEPSLDDLGRLDRISFNDGGSLLCFIRSRRTDADGNLISVQIVHRDGRGSETLSSSLIARIDEDVE